MPRESITCKCMHLVKIVYDSLDVWEMRTEMRKMRVLS